ncbi:ABC transporter ATP-binding protein [Oscillatoria sp. FACHB-1407]|uniref:heterocyst formation ABC transporter subunit HepA n=1 Tax=Oscillatoria sp. FACHB-1407 TaxID=2692847 RepID=UPI00168254EA|nr:heterocyst formation ABC transporter subunit HepA [Oscillatoria sp. FACHB-1407]MBD2459699.1 ABC transporter ATP-binding protein [Oscillatoria sp. FACHB-1407]
MPTNSFLSQLRLPPSIQALLKATTFWKDNAILLREIKYFRRVVVLALVFTFLAAAFEGFGIGSLLAFLQSLTDPNATPVQTGIKWFDVWVLGIRTSSTERLYRISVVILLITLMRASFTYLGNLYSKIAQFKLAYHLRLRLFSQLKSLSLKYFAQIRSGELVNVITTEIQEIMQAVGLINFVLIRASTLFVYIISMLLLSWQLTVISVMLFALLTVGVSTLLGRVREASFGKSITRGQYTSIAVEFINGIRTVHAFATQDFEQRRFDHANQELLKASTKSTSVQSLVEPISEAAATTIIIVMMILAFAILIPDGQLQIASLLTFLFILFRMLPIVKQLNGARAQISSFYGSIVNLKQVLSTDDKPYLQDGAIEFEGLERAIEFQSVDFGYDSEHTILHDVTLTIERGKTTALIGESGAGKSTLVDLIPRFYDPTKGQILVDSLDLRQLEINSLRRKIAVVSQDTFIFNDTVRNNIAYALENVEDQKIWEAAQLANAVEFIQELPHGFDTVLGDRGVRLSGGQRQRIAIARALLRDPEILILDEATSALDSVSERLIQESIEKLSKGRTVIAIAHRLSTITQADKVVVLEQGRVVEQGNYRELLSQQGKLWKYHQMQYEDVGT